MAEETQASPGDDVSTTTDSESQEAETVPQRADSEAPATETVDADAPPSLAEEPSTAEPAPVTVPVVDESGFTAVATPTTPAREVDGYEYEIMYILDPACDTAQAQEVVDRAREIVEGGEGALDNVRTSQMRRLAFDIKGHRDGIYVVLNLRSKPVAVRELDRFFKLEERVLRHMALRIDKK